MSSKKVTKNIGRRLIKNFEEQSHTITERNRKFQQSYNRKDRWKKRFINEFGVHFSKSELQFVLDFIQTEIDDARAKGTTKSKKKVK